jgi:alkaline phosphatase D
MGEEHSQMLGKTQMQWLLNNLKNSRAPFKFIAVGSQVLSDAAIYENFAQFPKERDWLLAELNRLNIKGVVFLTGDRHNSELSKLQLENGNWVYDLTVSPLTSGSYDHSEEPNSKREQGTMVGDRNYGMLEISGARKERILRMQVKSTEGDILWERSINADGDYELKM